MSQISLIFLVSLTFDHEVDWAALLPCVVTNLASVFSSMGAVHVVELHNNLVVLEVVVAGPT